MVEVPGDIMLTPQFNRGTSSTDQELLYSTVGFTQKGATLAAGQGVLVIGTCMAQRAQNKKWYKYDDSAVLGVTNEVQSVTEGGSGLTSFTLTYSGQTTASIAAAATAATVQTALEALSNIAVGDVTVTGAAGGPYTVTFGGALADTNVAQMTSTPTGGSGTVTVATVTGGNTADGTDVARGFLRRSVDTGAALTDSDKQGNIVIAGFLKLDLINAAANTDNAALLDLNARTDTVYGFLKF